MLGFAPGNTQINTYAMRFLILVALLQSLYEKFVRT